MRTLSMSTVEIASSRRHGSEHDARAREIEQAAQRRAAIVQTWNTVELTAVALANSSGGTRFGTSACEAGIAKARVTPNSVMTANTGTDGVHAEQREREQADARPPC